LNSSRHLTKGLYTRITFIFLILILILVLIFILTLAENKNQWKRSTMETQIQQQPSRERHPLAQNSVRTKKPVECILEKPLDGNSSPLCLSIHNGTEREYIKIKYISCNEEHNETTNEDEQTKEQQEQPQQQVQKEL